MTSTAPRFTVRRNARVGHAFSAVVDIEPPTSGPEPVSKIVIRGVTAAPDAMDDLTFDAATQTLTGTPLVAGEMTLGVVYGYEAAPGAPAEAPPPGLSAPLALFVNADPRTLWKNLPSDATGPDAKPDEAGEARLLDPPAGDGAPAEASPPRLLLAASQRGRSHAHTGAWRDDDFALAAAGAWQIVAVADGAGSASRSRRGAQIAVKVALEHASQTLEAVSLDELAASLGAAERDAGRAISPIDNLAFRALGYAAYHALKAIDAEATAQDLARRDYNTTLLLAAHARLPGGAGHLYLAYQIGDGAIGLYTPGLEGVATLELLGTPDGGAYAGQTRFLDADAIGSTDAIRERLVVRHRAEFAPLLVMSDGVSDPYFESDAALHDPAAWGRLWTDIAPAVGAGAADDGASLARWLDFFSPGHHDDRTLAVLV